MVAVISCSLLDGCCHFLKPFGWLRLHAVKASFVGVTGPCGSPLVPKVRTPRAPWQERPHNPPAPHNQRCGERNRDNDRKAAGGTTCGPGTPALLPSRAADWKDFVRPFRRRWGGVPGARAVGDDAECADGRLMDAGGVSPELVRRMPGKAWGWSP